ncbi:MULTISPECIES: cell division protein FtsZ [Bacteroidales]|jgi:cell division protein ftsZ|uniref:Cell division protein FtsZ n=1 Tax=Coprobacter secundus subsp. similis TaxID=2751153 RepID=A0A7G1HZ45_9BACT|nr:MULTISPECIES: cell division protein FtsZ [Bacteroidales]BCI64122.1 cell division protein FtsZ [Coprobacter secundus subsp. similis]
MDELTDNLPWDFPGPQSTPSIIKVIGVGGGGGNAVSHMYKEGIQDVTFVLCNTDNQALLRSEVPRKVQLGKTTTEGLGAGNRPERARLAAEESIDEIKDLFNDGTKMVFITAGMGGGTGTGAGPVIAKIAKELDILTVGIVTIPFLFEGERKILQAREGVKEMEQYVDALLVINNENLRKIYPDLDFLNAFGKADDTLTIAAKSIAEIITVEGHINLDFADVNSILKNGGKAIMSSGYGSGEKRVSKAIQDALNSPLLNDSDIYDAKKILFNLYFSSTNQIKMEEINEVNSFMAKFGKNVEVIWGAAIDDSLEETVKIIILATGFKDGASMASQNFIDPFEQQNEESFNDTQDSITEMYGPEAAKEIERNRVRASFMILKAEQMDDDALLELLDKSPTYNRDPQFAARLAINSKSGQNNESAPSAPQSSANTNTAGTAEGTIRF